MAKCTKTQYQDQIVALLALRAILRGVAGLPAGGVLRLEDAELVALRAGEHDPDLPEMENLFLEFFPDGEFPARMTATTEFIDADCLLMIEGIACRRAE